MSASFDDRNHFIICQHVKVFTKPSSVPNQDGQKCTCLHTTCLFLNLASTSPNSTPPLKLPSQSSIFSTPFGGDYHILLPSSIPPSSHPSLRTHLSRIILRLPLKTVPAVRIEPRRSWQKLHDRLRLFLRYMTHFHTRLRFFLCCMRKINIWLRFFLRWMTLNYLCFCLRAKTQSIGNRDRVESLDF